MKEKGDETVRLGGKDTNVWVAVDIERMEVISAIEKRIEVRDKEGNAVKSWFFQIKEEGEKLLQKISR